MGYFQNFIFHTHHFKKDINNCLEKPLISSLVSSFTPLLRINNSQSIARIHIISSSTDDLTQYLRYQSNSESANASLSGNAEMSILFLIFSSYIFRFSYDIVAYFNFLRKLQYIFSSIFLAASHFLIDSILTLFFSRIANSCLSLSCVHISLFT